MMKRITEWIPCQRRTDWSLLWLRIALGAALFIHDIGKMQNYNELIGTYPALAGLGAPATFVATTLAEAILAVLLMIGLRVRAAAGVTAVGMVWIAITSPFPGGEAPLACAAIAVALVVAGGGLYGLDSVVNNCRNARKGEQ